MVNNGVAYPSEEIFFVSACSSRIKSHLWKAIVSAHLWCLSFLLYSGKQLVTKIQNSNKLNGVFGCSFLKFNRLFHLSKCWIIELWNLPPRPSQTQRTLGKILLFISCMWNLKTVSSPSQSIWWNLLIPINAARTRQHHVSSQDKSLPLQATPWANGCEGGGGVARECCCPDRLEGESSVLDHSWKEQGQEQQGIGSSASDAQKPEEVPYGHAGGGENMIHYTQRRREEGQGGHPAIHTLRVAWKEQWMK